MKEVQPNYFEEFRCIAGHCRHTCCKGWEIDIDEEALALYQGVPGSFGERLRREIEPGDEAHFRLGSEGRCPFLNMDNLCDLILTLGEGALCQICRDHPRFRNFFSDRTEIGLGLCCEAAAQLVLMQTEKMTLLSNDAAEKLTAEEEWILETRLAYIELMQDRSLPILQRWNRLEKQTGVSIESRSPGQWAKLYGSLERLDPLWQKRLALLKDRDAFDHRPAASESWEIAFEQLTVYFLYRHLPGALLDCDLPARTAFSVLSARFIGEMCAALKNPVIEDLLELAREYSAEIEYSEDNLCAILDSLSLS